MTRSTYSHLTGLRLKPMRAHDYQVNIFFSCKCINIWPAWFYNYFRLGLYHFFLKSFSLFFYLFLHLFFEFLIQLFDFLIYLRVLQGFYSMDYIYTSLKLLS